MLIDARDCGPQVAKNWREGDRIRDELLALGIELKDKKDGTTVWKVRAMSARRTPFPSPLVGPTRGEGKEFLHPVCARRGDSTPRRARGNERNRHDETQPTFPALSAPPDRRRNHRDRGRCRAGAQLLSLVTSDEARAPVSLRHHAARRRADAMASTSRSTTRSRSSRCSTSSASITSRVAIPAPIRPTPRCSPSSAACRATFTAFGMTRRPGRSVSNDPGLAALLEAKAAAICFVAKSWDYHVRVALECTHRGKPGVDPRQSCAPPGRRAARCCSIASISSMATKPTRNMRWPVPGPPMTRAPAGSCCATPMAGRCRTRSRASSREVVEAIPGSHVGIHAHNDTEQAVANSLAAVRAGVRQIQGTLNGHRRALRQRQSRLHHPDAQAQARVRRSLRHRRFRRPAQRRSPTLSHRLDEMLEPRAQSPRALCRRKRLRHQGRHPCLRHHQGAGDLRARRAGDGRQSAQAAGVGSGRTIQRAGRARAHRDRGRARTMSASTRLLDAVKEREALGYAYESADASFELLARRVLGEVPGLLRCREIRRQRRAASQRAGRGA